MKSDNWTVYLSGEIHTDWRERIANGADGAKLPVTFLGPVTDHASSDDCGVSILGDEDSDFWKDHKGAKVNAIRTRNMIENQTLSSSVSVTSINNGTPPLTPALPPRWASR